MKKIALVALLALVSTTALAVDRDKNADKLDKQLHKINNVASVIAGRRVVNRVMADQFSVPRKQLVAERQRTGLAYGQLFALHEIATESNGRFEAISAESRKGTSLAEIARAHDVDLKSVADEAKKFNKELDKELADESDDGPDTPDASDDSGDGYDPSSDSQSADTSGMSPKQLSQNAANVQAQSHANANAQGLGLGRPTASGSTMGSTGISSPGSSGSARGRRP